MLTLTNLATRGWLCCLILAGLLLTGSTTGRAQQGSDPWKRRSQLQEAIRNCDGLIRKLESGEYVAVPFEGRLVSAPKGSIIEELTLQMLAGEITSQEMVAMSRMLGVATGKRLAQLRQERVQLVDSLRRVDADLGTDISGRTTPDTIRTPGGSTSWAGTWTTPWSYGTCTLTLTSASGSLSCQGTDADYGQKANSYNGTASSCTVQGNSMTCMSWDFKYHDVAKDVSGNGTVTFTLSGDTMTLASTVNGKAQETWNPPWTRDFVPWAARGVLLTLKRQ